MLLFFQKLGRTQVIVRVGGTKLWNLIGWNTHLVKDRYKFSLQENPVQANDITCILNSFIMTIFFAQFQISGDINVLCYMTRKKIYEIFKHIYNKCWFQWHFCTSNEKMFGFRQLRWVPWICIFKSW